MTKIFFFMEQELANNNLIAKVNKINFGINRGPSSIMYTFCDKK